MRLRLAWATRNYIRKEKFGNGRKEEEEGKEIRRGEDSRGRSEEKNDILGL